MYRVIGLGLFIAGVVLLAIGVSASESFSSEISRIFTGKPMNKSIWMILGGLVSILLGAGRLMASQDHPKRA